MKPFLNTKYLEYNSYSKILESNSAKIVSRLLIGFIIFIILFLFLPWTQTIESKGSVTTLDPKERPQDIFATIDGRIEKWYIVEGQFVKKGDTIAFLSETKEDYFDPQLVERTGRQVIAKEGALESYKGKVNALDGQIEALESNMFLKLQQAENKLKQAQSKLNSEFADQKALTANFSIMKQQYERGKELLEKGLKSVTDIENRENKFREAEAKLLSNQNKVSISESELLNARIELNAIKAEYADKISKAESDKFSALSSVLDSEAGIEKMKTQYKNYELRNTFYYITAPQNCYVSSINKYGIGEIIKAGTPLISIMPANAKIGVEAYVTPLDYPLLRIGAKTRIQFDGWPTLFISGWPGNSIGTYRGTIVSIDRVMNMHKKGFRVFIAPEKGQEAWPELIQAGSGVKTYTMLNDVAIGYELWRQLNGFPPEFYGKENPEKESKVK